MSIYTITLKRELLNSEEAGGVGEGGGGGGEEEEDCGQANWSERDPRFGRYDSAYGDVGGSAALKLQNCKRREVDEFMLIIGYAHHQRENYPPVQLLILNYHILPTHTQY